MFPVMTGALVHLVALSDRRCSVLGGLNFQGRMERCPLQRRAHARRLAIRNHGLCRLQFPDVPWPEPLKYTTLTTGLSLISMLVIDTILLASKLIPVPPADAVVSILPHLAYMAFCAGFVAVLSWNVGNKILTPLNGMLFINVIPLTSFAISALEGLAPTTAQILGAGLTGLALIGNNLTVRAKPARFLTIIGCVCPKSFATTLRPIARRRRQTAR